MIKFRDLVLLMHALQWLERTSGIFNYAALGTACQYQRAFTRSLSGINLLFMSSCHIQSSNSVVIVHGQ